MNTTSERLAQLFKLHISQKATEPEQQELWDYVDDPLYAPQIEGLLSDAFTTQNDDYSLSHLQAENVLQQVFKNKEKPIASVRKLWPRIGIAAAAILIVLSIAIWFYKVNQTRNTYLADMAKILPGKQGATLTLSTGKKILLTTAKEGELAKEQGIAISKTTDGQLFYTISDPSTVKEGAAAYNTLSTGNGETYTVKLPDGSLVYLNAASSITYDANLAKAAVRKVELKGEGYFEVARRSHPTANATGTNISVPFIVVTGKQEVEVLGTHFDINGYTDEKLIRTTLLEGSVRVSRIDAGREASAMLKPNQQSILFQNNYITVQNVNAQDAIAWKNGFFRFEDASVETVLRQFARWYDVEIVYTGKMPNRLFTGEIYRNLSFAEALKIMDFSKIKFKMQGKKLIVSP